MTIAPDIPVTKFVADVLAHLETLSHFKRRLFIKNRMPGQYPRFFYKYLGIKPGNPKSVDRLRDLLVRSRFWLADHERFNDPFDLKANIVIVGTERQRKIRFQELIANQSREPRKRRREILNQMMKRPRGEWDAALKEIFLAKAKEVGVCSFAGAPRNILMWSHYGQSHEGLCLQFETALSPRAFTIAHPVEYSEEYPQVNFVNDFASQLLTPLLRKHKGWEYECEWRILHLAGANSSLPFDPRALRRIVVGCKAPPQVYAAIESLLRERYVDGLPKVEVFRAVQHSAKYALQLWRLQSRPEA